jgi:hypothetical protein
LIAAMPCAASASAATCERLPLPQISSSSPRPAASAGSACSRARGSGLRAARHAERVLVGLAHVDQARAALLPRERFPDVDALDWPWRAA